MSQLTRRFRRVLQSIVILLVVALQAVPAQAQNLYITGDGVRLRSDPSLSAPILKHLHYGTAITKINRIGEFYRVQTQDGNNGYVHAGYASVSSPPPRARIAQLDQKTYTVWMNTKTWVYHNSNCRWYGNTRYGEFMSNREAAKVGRPCGICGG